MSSAVVQRMIPGLDERPPHSTQMGPGESVGPDFVRGRIAVQATGLTFERGRVRIFEGLDLIVELGEILAVTGPNGAGKTTLIKLLAGLLEPRKGHVRWFGGVFKTAQDLRRNIGYAGHQSHSCRDLTAIENLLFAARLHGLEDAQSVARNALQECGLDYRQNCPVARLSQGECRRLSLARAVIHRPRLVFLDEPFSNLDDRGRAWLNASLKQWRLAGTTVCYSTHEHDHRQGFADRRVQLEGGAICVSLLRSAG